MNPKEGEEEVVIPNEERDIGNEQRDFSLRSK